MTTKKDIPFRKQIESIIYGIEQPQCETCGEEQLGYEDAEVDEAVDQIIQAIRDRMPDKEQIYKSINNRPNIKYKEAFNAAIDKFEKNFGL